MEEGKAATQPRRTEAPRPSYPSGLSAACDRGDLPPAWTLPSPGSEATPDFSRIDFDRLWSGRGKVTEVEGAILARALAREPPGPGLEIGSGAGRLTPYFARWSHDLVASDATLSLLRRPPSAQPIPPPRVGANIYHLPFADGVFTAATLVRVFGFLTDPDAALREVHRVLRPRGVLVLSFEPHPTVSSLLDDLKVGFSQSRRGGMTTMTFSRASVVPVRPSAYPAWSHTRAHVRAVAEAVGFSLEAEYPCGLEDLIGFRRLPTSVFLSLARALSRMGGFPTRFVLFRKESPTGRADNQENSKSNPPPGPAVHGTSQGPGRTDP